MGLLHRFVVSAVSCLAVAVSILPARAAPPDADFYTSYAFYNSKSVDYSVCGASSYGDGCYGGGSIGPFGRVGCLIEGFPVTNGNAVTRAIYIVDVASGKTGKGVTLYRYLKTDTVSSTEDDSITVVLTNTVSLPLVGSLNAVCMVAGTTDFLYVGTDQNSTAVRITKGAFSLEEISSSPQYTIKSITTDQLGYATLSYTEPGVANSDSFLLFAPSGRSLFDGGGDAFLLTPYTGLSNTSTSP